MMGRWGGDSPWESEEKRGRPCAPVSSKAADYNAYHPQPGGDKSPGVFQMDLDHSSHRPPVSESLGFVGRGEKTPEDMERENPSKETVLITGGSGYFGFRLGLALAKSKVDVILLDVSKPTQEMPKGVKFVQGDVCEIHEVEQALQELVHFALGRLYNFQPLLTRTEVSKTGVTHFFSLAKARRELGYEPGHYSLREVVEWFQSRGHGQKLRRSSEKHFIRNTALVFLAAVMVILYIPTFSWSFF
ncbi:short-chain dehydrogenase/reductase family 42E member 1 [Crotalus adamanteus]|uniref:Short-chain dehydrogenase/reductase family 42E member 1 n=1 Tax=Crotalus adamanteus TaxID=8729 RepID=A0AAW1AS81_CROAD